MGNQQTTIPRERHKSGSQDLLPGSPLRGSSAVVKTRNFSRYIFETQYIRKNSSNVNY